MAGEDVIQNRFAIAPAKQVNYDFNDVVTNQAYIVTYGLVDLAGSTTLIRQQIDSHYPSYKISYSGGGTGAVLEKNFDYQFKVPQKVEGKAYVRVVFFAQATATQTVDCTLKIRILHYDGSTETLIGTQQTTHTVTITTDSATRYSMATLSFDLDRAFKIDEKLRVEIEVNTTTATNAAMGFLADAGNNDYGIVLEETTVPAPSNLIVYIPVNPVD